MKKKKIYIFNGNTRAAVYGIGTYITQLTECLKDASISFGVINIYAEGSEIVVTEKEGYQLISIPAVRYCNNNSHQYYTRNIGYLLKEFIPDEKDTEYIFHLNFMNSPALASGLRKMFKCKIILVAHYSNWSFSLLGDYEKLKQIVSRKQNQRNDTEKQIVREIKEDTRMISKCDKFVCIAQHSLNSFTENCHFDVKKVVLINNALKDSYIPLSKEEKRTIRNKYHISQDTQVLLFAGRLDEVKGISYLIQAFREILKTNPNARLLLIGDGNFNQWLKEAENIWSQVTFTGRVNQDTLYELYQIANIGIVSSIHEEFGFVAIEMMMHQLPVIVTDTGGLSEIIENKISGLKIPVYYDDNRRTVDINTLTANIRVLLKQPEYAKKLGINGRKRFLEKYELSVFKKKC